MTSPHWQLRLKKLALYLFSSIGLIAGSMQSAIAAQEALATPPSFAPDEVRHYHRQSSRPIKLAYWSDAQSALVGSLERRVYKQWFRAHILFRDLEQHVQAEGRQPLSTAVTPSGMQTLHVVNGQGEPLLDVQGLSLKRSPLRFRLSNKEGVPIADAWLDSVGREIRFTLVDHSFLTFAIATREEQNAHHWELAVFDHSIVPELAWPILIDFFTDERRKP